MKLGTQVGLGSGHILLDGNPAPLPHKWHSRQSSVHAYDKLLFAITMANSNSRLNTTRYTIENDLTKKDKKIKKRKTKHTNKWHVLI